MPSQPETAATASLSACTDLARINHFPTDEFLRFESEGHKYFYNDTVVGCSATWLACILPRA